MESTEATVEVETRALSLVEQAKGMQIRDAAAFRLAGEFLLTCKAMQEEIDAVMDPPISAAEASRKAAVASKRAAELAKEKVSRPVIDARALVKAEILRWQELEAAKNRRIADERAAADRRRQEDEQVAIASALESLGRKEEAEAILERPVPTIAVSSPAPTKVSGVSIATLYRADVVDLFALVQHVAQNKELLGLLEVNQAALNRQATSLKEGLNLPGVMLRIDKSVRA